MIEVDIKTQEGTKVYVSEWDEGGAWIRLGVRNGSLYATLTREEANELSGCLQAILAKSM
jgi:ABC-type Zn2+ transport system substrate-binding protein/surface adhesin